MKLDCECGNETEFYEETMVTFIIDAEGNREEKLIKDIHYYCIKCDKEVFMGVNMKLEDAIQTVLENTPPLECPECKFNEADCIIDVTYPDPSIIRYNYACPKCGTRFTEIFCRIEVEKVGE